MRATCPGYPILTILTILTIIIEGCKLCNLPQNRSYFSLHAHFLSPPPKENPCVPRSSTVTILLKIQNIRLRSNAWIQMSLETFHEVSAKWDCGLRQKRLAKTTRRNSGRALHGCLFRSTSTIADAMTLTAGRAKRLERDRRTSRRFCYYMKRAGLPACQAFVFSRWTDGARPSFPARSVPPVPVVHPLCTEEILNIAVK